MKKTYGIGQTAAITGVSHRKLRHWEKQGYIPESKRIICGERAYRRYSEEHIKFIHSVKEFCDQGFTLKAASTLTKDNFKKKEKYK